MAFVSQAVEEGLKSEADGKLLDQKRKNKKKKAIHHFEENAAIFFVSNGINVLHIVASLYFLYNSVQFWLKNLNLSLFLYLNIISKGQNLLCWRSLIQTVAITVYLFCFLMSICINFSSETYN